jgi:hypothetical protein
MTVPPIRLTRRRVLGGAAALPVLGLPGLPGAQAYGVQVSLILDGVGPGMDPDIPGLVAGPFLAAGLPVTCVADLAALTADPGGAGLCDRLATLALDHPALFDLALPIGKLQRTERYFQLRRAGELRDAVVRAFATGPAAGQSFPVVTLIDRGDDPNIDHTAFRGAGFRVHLAAGDGPWRHRPAGRGELVGSGGLWLRLDAVGLEDRIRAELAAGRDLLLALSLAGLAAPTSDLVARAGRLAALLADAAATGRAVVASPAQLRLYAGAGLPVDVALVVVPGTGPDEDAAAQAFLRDLAGQGVPLTLAAPAGTYGELPGTVEFCPSPDAERPLPLCLQSLPGAPADPAVATYLDPSPAVWPAQGIDPDGRMRLTLRQVPGDGPDAVLDVSPLEDHLIAIPAAALLQPAQRARLVRRLVEANLSGQAYFHTVSGLAAHLVETEPVLSRLWSLRRRRRTDPLRTPRPDGVERDRLLEDARFAWRYIDRFTDGATGLCAGTVQGGARLVVNRDATLWDLASQLHGIRAAWRLALIGQDEARARTTLLARNLPLAEVAGARLPPAMFRTDDGSIVAPGFDVCDAGRFMIALRAVVADGLLDGPAADKIVAGWDLAAALPDGRPRSHANGQWLDTTLSHCTPYIRRGMKPWGFTLVSPHPGLAGGTDSDRAIALLYDIAAIGQVGVEPVLLDLIELGPDPEAELLAETLFDAQLHWFETTGQLKCASEGPLNFPPWFSYQGLRLGRLGDEAWAVRGLGGAAEHDTPDFRARAEMISTKSAYLWAAVRAHPLCDRLLEVVRAKARIDGLGFSAGVFTATMEAMEDYTDLNTNGIILTAIGHALR